MTDEIKAAAERFANDSYPAIDRAPGLGGQQDRDRHTLAMAYLSHLDREAERAKLVTVEWLKSLCVSISVAGRCWFLEWKLYLFLKDDKFWVVLSGQQIEVRTRGQVMDLCNLFGFTLGWHLEGKVKP